MFLAKTRLFSLLKTVLLTKNPADELGVKKSFCKVLTIGWYYRAFLFSCVLIWFSPSPLLFRLLLWGWVLVFWFFFPLPLFASFLACSEPGWETNWLNKLGECFFLPLLEQQRFGLTSNKTRH